MLNGTMPAPRRLKFGVLTFPIHRPWHDPTLQLETDLDLAEWCDRLGYDEFWFGEHHSGGWQIISSPELMIAAAAQRTRRIRLGTGVTTLAYHHPLTVLDRIVQLDHLTRGRLIFGVGSGALALDSEMLGADPMDARRKMEESLEAITALLRFDGPVNVETDWFTIRDGHLQLRPYSEELDIRVASFRSPSGPRAAGRFGAGLLSFGAAAALGAGDENPMTTAWEIAERRAREYGQSLDRRRWSAVSPVHVAPTEEQARHEVAWGLPHYIKYLRQILPLNVPVDTGDVDAVVDVLRTVGHAVIGTPAQAIAHIEEIQRISGGIGTFVIEHGELADPEASRRSYDLFAREVIPHFTGQLEPRLAAYQRELRHDGRTRRTMAAAQAMAGIQDRLDQRAARQPPAPPPARADPAPDLIQTPPPRGAAGKPLTPAPPSEWARRRHALFQTESK